MTARWTETTLRIDLDDHTDFTVDTTGLPDGDVRVSFCSTPPVEVLMSRECAEVLERRLNWAHRNSGTCRGCGRHFTDGTESDCAYCADCISAEVAS